jgi:hypothetical protein
VFNNERYDASLLTAVNGAGLLFLHGTEVPSQRRDKSSTDLKRRNETLLSQDMTRKSRKS